jgi:hypothetical protein
MVGLNAFAVRAGAPCAPASSTPLRACCGDGAPHGVPICALKRALASVTLPLRARFLTTTRTRDAETHLLQGFGHLDVLTGTFARAQVFVPMETWLQRH